MTPSLIRDELLLLEELLLLIEEVLLLLRDVELSRRVNGTAVLRPAIRRVVNVVGINMTRNNKGRTAAR